MATKSEQYCKWICEELEKKRRITKDDFISAFGGENNLKSDWVRSVHAVEAVLLKLNIAVETIPSGLFLPEGVKLTPEPPKLPPERRYEEIFKTARFRPDDEISAKAHIGELVAEFLKNELVKDKSVFLGSGSTIFHVGLKMCNHDKYEQLFWTVNIALAAVWCINSDPPVANINIPAANLQTRSFRFATMQPPGWSPAIAIVGADGCYTNNNGDVVLYGNEDSVAINTNLFVQNATHSVFCCLTNKKIKMGLSPTPNTGPPINPPKRQGVIQVLVTDEKLDDNSARAFQKAGWSVVANKADWEPIFGARQKGAVSAKKL